MRAGPLSDQRVIDLLNTRFIAITISNDDYNNNGGATAAEKRERQRISDETRVKLDMPRIAAADVEAYILAPDGSVDSTMRLPELEETQRVIDWFNRALTRLGTTGGEPVVPPSSPSPPRTESDELVLHQTTRYLFGVRSAGDGAAFDRRTTMEDKRRKAMTALPTEDWVVLVQSDWNKLLGPENAKLHEEWEIDRKTAEKLLGNVRPSTTNNDAARRRIENIKFRGTLISKEDGVATARLEGNMRMWYPFLLFRDDDDYLDVSVIGFVDFDTKTRKVRSLRLATDKGTYLGVNFGAVLRTVP